MRKQFIIAIVSLLGLALPFGAQAQDRNIFNHLSVGAHAATTGFGFELAAPITDYVSVRAGMSFMPGFTFSTNVDGELSYQSYTKHFDMDVKGDLSRTQASLIFNAYPFGARNPFYVAAGAYFGGSKIVDLHGHTDDFEKYLDVIGGFIEVGNYEIPVDKEGNAYGQLKVNSFRPYLGLGYGRAIPSRRVNFGVELGVQFMGRLTPYSGGQKLVELLADNNDDWQKLMDKLKVYPVLKFTISGKIF
ncbi:MAG: hypothetical protein NC342_08045 [Pseudoflavonifractor sp.]|nr:hypothetical protein [Alloprevotella sp.]MCM1117472.1 hypothetical protein [Pseudoflavonifractor sp.]